MSAQFTTFGFPLGIDFVLGVTLNPPAPLTGLAIHFQVSKRFGSMSGLLDKYYDPTLGNGVSGITLQDGSNGVYNVTFNAVDTSGWLPLNYAFQSRVTSSGSQDVLNYGYLIGQQPPLVMYANNTSGG